MYFSSFRMKEKIDNHFSLIILLAIFFSDKQQIYIRKNCHGKSDPVYVLVAR